MCTYIESYSTTTCTLDMGPWGEIFVGGSLGGGGRGVKDLSPALWELPDRCDIEREGVDERTMIAAVRECWAWSY
jgi:hypothetical protein